jgi:hypothetical protein
MIAALFLTDNQDIESVVGVTSLFKKFVIMEYSFSDPQSPCHSFEDIPDPVKTLHPP